jgi:hypothetical protein
MTGTNLIIGAVIHGDVEPPETTYYCDWTWQESIRWIDLRDLTTAKDPVWLRAAACSCPEFVAAVHRIPAGIGDHDLAEQCRRGDRMDRIRLRPVPRSSRPTARRLADDSVLLAVPRSELYVETRSWATTALVLGIFLLPHLGSRVITGWLYNGAGFSVLIAGFHSMHNAIVNTTGLVAVVALPQFDVLLIMAGSVVLAAAIIAVATGGRLGLRRSLARRPEYLTAWPNSPC